MLIKMVENFVSKNELNINTNDNRLEMVSLIWLDSDEKINDNRDVQQNLRSIINQLKIFQDSHECQRYIELRPKEDRLILIVSGQIGHIAIPLIHRYQQVLSIYVYGNDKKNYERWTSQFLKVRPFDNKFHFHPVVIADKSCCHGNS